MCVCIRLISRSNHSIRVCLFFLFYSRVFISRSYENHSIPRMFFRWETSWVVAPNVGCFLRLTFWWSQTFPLNHLDPRGTLLILRTFAMSVFKTEPFSTLLQDWGYNTVYSFLNTTITCVVITILFTKCMYKYLAMISSLTKQLYFCDIASALVELSNTYTLYKCCGKQLSLPVLVFS